MKSYLKQNRGFGIISVIVAVVLIGITSVGIVQYASAVGEQRRQMDTRVQENSYRVFQNELTLSGANPNGMAANPLGGASNANSPIPRVNLVATAGRDQAGSAKVSAYAASTDEVGRSASMGFRIADTASALPPPPTSPLLPPSFRVSGVVPESEFSPDLTNLILGNAGNPPGTVYRYTTDGSDPTSASPIWTGGSTIPAYPLPSEIRTAAFSSDPQYTTSPVVVGSLSRNLSLDFSRSLGGTSTAFTYAEVTGGSNGINLSISNPPAGTTIYYTYDGSVPTSGSAVYSGSFQVPLASWSSSVTLRAIALAPSSNITVSPLSVALSPSKVALPAPILGTPSGTTTVLLPVSSVVPGVIIRYDIDTPVAVGSPTVTSGSNISVSAL